MDVSVCIVSWNTRDLLYECIKSIKEKTTGINYEIIIVDNASSDGSTDMVLEKCPDCKLIASKRNLGFARGNNRAVQEASGKYILYLNPDTELITNAVYGMFSYLEKNNDVGAIGCRLVDADGKILNPCAGTFPTPFNTINSLLFLNRIFKKSVLFSARELDYWNHEDSRHVDCISGACMMVRKQIIDEIEGFDENIFMYAEDLDICFRILRSGWKIYYLSEEVIAHYEGASSKKKGKYFSTLRQKESDLYFFKKNYGYVKAILYKSAICIGAIFRIFVIIFAYPIYLLCVSKKKNIKEIFIENFKILLWALGFINVK
jgi:GT2 family glycosyltransferase